MASRSLERITVVGAGFMGWQIALTVALHGYPVRILYRSEDTRRRAEESQAAELDRQVQRGLLTAEEKGATLSRLHFTREMGEGVADADLVIESVSENLAVKREVFAALDRACPAKTIIATNSSSLRVRLMEDATRRLDRVLNLHFYHRPWDRPLVELMRGSATSDETLESVRAFCRAIGLTPLIVRKESTGFLFNRVWRAIKKECLHLVDEGVATFEDVDRAWMLSFGLPIGPFGRMDAIGLDVVRDIEMVYYQESGDPSDAPPRILLERIARGELGVKTGKGFYTYPHPAYEDPAFLKGDR